MDHSENKGEKPSPEKEKEGEDKLSEQIPDPLKGDAKGKDHMMSGDISSRIEKKDPVPDEPARAVVTDISGKDDEKVPSEGGKGENKGPSDDGKIGTDDEKIDPDDEKIGTDDGKIGTDGEKIGTDGEKIGTDGEKIGTDGEKIGTDDGKIGTGDGKIDPDDEKIGTDDGKIDPDDEKIGTDDGKAEVEKEQEPTVDVKMPVNIFPARMEQAVDLTGFPTRVEVLSSLIEKHVKLNQEYSGELEGLSVVPGEMVADKEEQKKKRDDINQEVSALKSERTDLKAKNKKLRRELFDLIRKEERLKEKKDDVKMYSRFCEDTEWKLETEAIDLETERRLLEELRSTMDRIRTIFDGLTPDEMSKKLLSLDEEIEKNSVKIEDLHQAMLGKVEEANVHHDRYLEASGKIKGIEKRRSWLKRRIELHKEMEKFWFSQQKAAEELDREDATRTLKDIIESVKKTMVGREGPVGERDGRKEKRPPTKDDRKGKKDKGGRPGTGKRPKEVVSGSGKGEARGQEETRKSVDAGPKEDAPVKAEVLKERTANKGSSTSEKNENGGGPVIDDKKTTSGKTSVNTDGGDS